MTARTPLSSPVDDTTGHRFRRADGSAPAPVDLPAELAQLEREERIELIVRAIGDAQARHAEARHAQARHAGRHSPPGAPPAPGNAADSAIDLSEVMRGALLRLSADGTPIGRVMEMDVRVKSLRGGITRTRIVIELEGEPR